jgi:hypothetical protein
MRLPVYVAAPVRVFHHQRARNMPIWASIVGLPDVATRIKASVASLAKSSAAWSSSG